MNATITYKDMLQDLFDQQQEYISYFFEHLDLASVDEMVRRIYECEGVVFFSGVGKSGIVAQKLATTMTSTGTKALFIPPTDALHGDLGIAGPKDMFILLSKSGESEELITLVPCLRNKGAQVVTWISQMNTRLVKMVDFAVHLPLKRELCPFGLAPMTSAAIQMIFGDILAVALMKMRGFSLDQYAVNHPAGRIGKRISCRVSDIMLQGADIPFCMATDFLQDVIVELSNKRCGCLVVVDNERCLQGIFTDGDLSRAIKNRGSLALEQNVGNLMTRSPKWIKEDTLAWDAMKLMEADPKCPITVLPVLDDDHKMVGLVKMHDIIQMGL